MLRPEVQSNRVYVWDKLHGTELGHFGHGAHSVANNDLVMRHFIATHLDDEKLVVAVAHAFHRRIFRAKKHRVWNIGKGKLEGICGPIHTVALGMAHSDAQHFDEWRIAELLALMQLILKHAGIVVLHHFFDDKMCGLGSLDDHTPLSAPAASAATNLRHQLIGTFKSAEIGIVEQLVGIEDAHKTNMVEVEALGDHLRAHKNVDSTLLKIADNALIGVFAPRGV